MRHLQISPHSSNSHCCQSLKHYRVLLWKDYLLRRRSFWLILAELMFCLVFVIVIAVIRGRYSAENMSSCYIQSQSMTSMGLLTYMQSLICNFNYTCYDKNPQSFVTLNGIAPLIYFLDNVTHLVDNPVFIKWLNNPKKFETEQLVDWLSFGLKLTHLKISADHLKEWINNYLIIFLNSSSIESMKYISQLICGTSPDHNDLGRFLDKLIQPINEEMNDQLINNIPILNQLMHQFNEHIGIDIVSATNILTEKSISTYNLCPLITNLLKSGPFLMTFGRLRYFLFGQLVYYPSNQYTDEIIYNMGRYTRLLNNFRHLTNYYFNDYRPWLLNFFYNKTYLIIIHNYLNQCQNNENQLYPKEIKKICYYLLNILNKETSEYDSIHSSWKIFLQFFDNFINLLHNLLTNCFQLDKKYLSFNNRKDFDNYLLTHQDNILTSPIGVIFDQIPAYFNHTINHNNNNDLEHYPTLEMIKATPNLFSISIRKDTSYIYPTNNYKVIHEYDMHKPYRDPQKEMNYFTSGFIDVQEQLSKSIIEVISKKIGANNIYTKLFNDIGIEMKMFPNPPYIQDDILINIIYLLPQIMVLTWILSVILSVKYMVDEKENGLIDFLSTFGINLSINWLAWISISFILMSFFSIPIVLILKYCKIIPLSNIIIIYFLIINYTIACLIYCIIFTILSKRATIASIIAGITYLLLYMPAAIILRYDELMNDNWILLFCLIPQVSHALSWVFLNRLELHGSGAQWSNIWNTNYSQSILTLGTTIIFLWIGIILLYCLTFWGIPFINRIYALFIYKYLFNKNYSNHTISMKGVKRRRKRKLSNIALYNDTLSTDSSQLLVNNTQGNISTSIIQSPSVIVDNLCKIYEPDNRAALCNVNMNFYEDQITVILGRNGAGKTTLLSILVGILQPTDGRIIMHGKETHKYSHILRQILGYCPQYNILYDSLTVTEHIYLFGTLKGVNNNTLNDNMNDYLCKLGLFDKRNELAYRLSGGQRRKLSLFLAFLGQSSVIILDEPTASLDPFSRRAIWDLLKSLRKGRTIILSSHHMYESELLADQIMIISEGKVLSSGSTLSLKSTYGSGYHLLLEIDSSKFKSSTDHNNNNNNNTSSIHELMKAIEKYINGARLLRYHHGNKLMIYLPSCNALTGSFTSLFQQLDNLTFRQTYHIQHYEISDSSLEEVFLTITNDNNNNNDVQTMNTNYIIDSNNYHENEYNDNSRSVQFEDGTTSLFIEEIDSITDHHCKNYHHRIISDSNNNNSSSNVFYKNVIKAMFYKRFIYIKRHKLSWIIEFVFPSLLIIVAIGFLKYFTPNNIQPSMDINHWLLKGKHTKELLHFYAYNNNDTNNNDILLSSNEEENPIKLYLKLLNKPMSLSGIGCIQSKLHTFQPSITSNCLIKSNEKMKFNNKNYYSHICSNYKKLLPMKSCNPLITGDILLDLSSYDISTYLINHSKLLHNILFGGIELINVEKFELNKMFYNIFKIIGNYSFILNNNNNNNNNNNTINWKEFLTSLQLLLPPSKMLRIWYNNYGYISSIAYLNLIQNFQYRLILSSINEGIGYSTNSGIIITNYPLTNKKVIKLLKLTDTIKSDYILSLFFILALSFIPASFISLLVYERCNNSKHLQNLSGVLPSIYWLTNLIYDFITYLISSSFCIIILILHGDSAFIKSNVIYLFILIIYLYGFAMISLIYLVSFLFKYPSTAFVLICGLNVVISTITTFVCFFIEILSFETGQYTNSTKNILNWLRISPHYCLSNSIYTIAVKDFFFKTGLPYKRNTSLWSLLSIDMLCLLLQGILLFLIVLLLEKRFYIGQIIYWKNKKLKYGHKKINIGSGYTHLESNSQNSEYLPFNTPYAINAESIVKHYWCQKKATVEHLSLTVQPGECYGLLGVNGAGKSTIYSMLTGNCTITDGHIYLNGYDIELNEAKAFQSIGYCPQQDALCEFMTVREILTFYSYLKCYNNDNNIRNYNYIVNKMIQLTGLQDYADQIISKLSGGNKRKLSTCIAFIGNPSIILLDEPSTGMDPQGKYLLWKNIKNALQLNCAILLSSHCMEECELLCNSIGLLINGKICCKGSPLELKTNYGLGYHVNIEFTSNIIQFSNMNKLQSIINQYLPNFQLRYPLLSRQEYNYSKLQPLWKLFNGLEQLNKLNLINYISIRQSSLEDVFVNFINMYEKKK